MTAEALQHGHQQTGYLRAFREWLVMDTQEVRSSCFSLEQNLLRLRQVLSVILVQPFRFSTSMFLQFWAKVLWVQAGVGQQSDRSRKWPTAVTSHPQNIP